MTREERRARRKAATKRKRKRTPTWKARQAGAKAVLGASNLLALGDRMDVVEVNRKREKNGKKPKRLPVLRHAQGDLPESIVTKVLD